MKMWNGDLCTGSHEQNRNLLINNITEAWRVANSLQRLLAQINDIAPNRNTASDGSIGDPAHCPNADGSGPSDHCRRYIPVLGSTKVVTARDFTHDPGHGANMSDISKALRISRDPRIKYVIWNRSIFSGADGPSPWTWRPYSGSNPHDKHMHVSVVGRLIADLTSEWEIGDMIVDDLTPSALNKIRLAVLGREFPTVGRTLAGSVEALVLNQAEQFQTLLTEINEDNGNPVHLEPDQIPVLAQLLADLTPKAGTFTLTPTQTNP